MNKSVLVNNMLAKAGLGSVSVDSTMQPVHTEARDLRDFQCRCYLEAESSLAQAETLRARAKALKEGGNGLDALPVNSKK